MLDNLTKLITVVTFIFITMTYAPWFIASFHEWENDGPHGCLRLRVSPTEVKANIESALREKGNRIETRIAEGVPILFWVGNAVFSVTDESRTHSGFVKMSLGFSKLTLTTSYSGNEPFTETISFQRKNKCELNGKIWNH